MTGTRCMVMPACTWVTLLVSWGVRSAILGTGLGRVVDRFAGGVSERVPLWRGHQPGRNGICCVVPLTREVVMLPKQVGGAPLRRLIYSRSSESSA
jgi:hypothetical protein